MATQMYKVVSGKPGPVPVMADLPSYPNRDADGDTIFENTHFLNLDAAWEYHLAEHRAGQSIAAGNLEYARAELEKREKLLCDAALAYSAALKAHEEYERSKA